MLRLGPTTIDFVRLEATGPSGVISLTQREADLLEYLANRPGQTVSHQELLTEVWGYHPSATSRAPYHAVARLRRRLEQEPSKPRYLVTVRGVGFRLEVATDARTPARAHAPRWSRLPRRRTRFFGREVERTAIVARFREGPTPLVTIVGLGGIGKTRLALEVGHELTPHVGDVVFCDLSDVRSESSLLSSVSRTLGVSLGAGVPPLSAVSRELASRGPVLLLLDSLGGGRPGSRTSWRRCWRDAPIYACSSPVASR